MSLKLLRRLAPLSVTMVALWTSERADAQNRVSGIVWADQNGDGLQGDSESGLGGVEVLLLDRYGVPIEGRQTQTNLDGTYVFTAIEDGEYRVAIKRPAGYRFTQTRVGGRDPGGARHDAETRDDDSDINRTNGHRPLGRRGSHRTGMTYVEWTRLDENEDPWPINAWIVYPANPQKSDAYATVRDIYVQDTIDHENTVAAMKVGIAANLGLDPSIVVPADPESVLVDTKVVLDAPVDLVASPYPVLILFTGLVGGVADMVEVADLLASHGYVGVCLETSAFHSSIALGDRLVTRGGPYLQSDFDHVPQLGGQAWIDLLGFGYRPEGFLMGDFNLNFNEQSRILAADASEAIDRLEAWQATPGHLFEEMLDLEHIGWIGFSAGAGRSRIGVSGDDRVDLVINIDSATYLDVPKPALWIGNSNNRDNGAPAINARLPQDVHPHYVSVPAIRFEPEFALSSFHREFHQELRDELIVPFCGYWLKSINAYREDLGIDGNAPDYRGYVLPYVVRNHSGFHTDTFTLEGATVRERDAGLRPQPLYILEGERLVAMETTFLGQSGDVGSASLIDYGRLLFRGAGLGELEARRLSLAIDSERQAWFLDRLTANLWRLDLDQARIGGPNPVQFRGKVRGCPRGVESLSFDPRSGFLKALVTGPSSRLVTIDPMALQVISQSEPMATMAGTASGACVDARGEPWVTQDVALHRHSRLGGAALEEIPVSGANDLSTLTYDPVSHRVLGVDREDASLHSIDIRSGDSANLGTLRTLGLNGQGSIAVEPRALSSIAMSMDLKRHSIPNGPARPTLFDQVRIEASGLDWEGVMMRVHFVDRSGDPQTDVMELTSGGNIVLGSLVDLDFETLNVGEGREVLHRGAVVGWFETNWGLEVGGERLLPLTIIFSSLAKTSAVEEVLASIRYRGEGGVRIAVEFKGPGGEWTFPVILER